MAQMHLTLSEPSTIAVFGIVFKTQHLHFSETAKKCLKFLKFPLTDWPVEVYQQNGNEHTSHKKGRSEAQQCAFPAAGVAVAGINIQSQNKLVFP